MTMQRTLLYSVSGKGISLHSGDMVRVWLRPAPENTGIVFKRVDLDPPITIPARTSYVSNTQSCTAIAKGGAEIQTIEHLLSAFAGFGIDNAIVEVDGGELPAMDGSANVFVLMIKSAGIKELSADKRFIRIKETVTVRDGDKHVSLSPSKHNGFSIKFSIDFYDEFNARHPLSVVHDFSTNSFVQDISRSRTFGFVQDFNRMQELGLARGACMKNAIKIHEDGSVANTEGLRSREELVKHKILDVCGDLSLLGYGLLGHFESYKSGHALNNKLLKNLLERKDAWEMVVFDGDEELNIRYDYFPIAVD
jgi:UDP-3-O-[3-hydroxymyristoyl] N-acetylglucosamine deacetylase